MLLLLCIGVLTAAFTAGIGLCRAYPPVPEVHDEFGILLAADTYASGRLTNPPHPMAKFFDTIYVIQQPTYMGKYPPVQALMLALGKILTGEFIVGAWISCGIMAAAIFWMLQAFVSLRWALYGTLIAALQIGIFSYWSHSYWGSTMAVAAGAMVIGGAVRVLSQSRTIDALVMSAGLIILANARPYDGLAAALVPLMALAWKAWSSSGDARTQIVRRVVIPFAIILGIGATWMCYNNYRVTGDPLKLPYKAHSEQYMIVPAFLWQRISEQRLTYTHEALRVHHEGWEVQFYLIQRALGNFVRVRLLYLAHIWQFYVNWVLTIPFLIGVFIALRRPYRLAFASMICVFAAVTLTTWSADRFVSPVGSVLFLLVTLGMRWLTGLSQNRHLRLFIAATAPLLILGMMLAFNKQVVTPDIASVHPMKQHRADVIQKLLREPGKDLVFVRATPTPDSYFEWVYNGANIDQQQVVFARYHGIKENEALIAYYPDRRIWLLDVGESGENVRIREYLVDGIEPTPLDVTVPRGITKSCG